MVYPYKQVIFMLLLEVKELTSITEIRGPLRVN
jgi:hypothetical protein